MVSNRTGSNVVASKSEKVKMSLTVYKGKFFDHVGGTFLS